MGDAVGICFVGLVDLVIEMGFVDTGQAAFYHVVVVGAVLYGVEQGVFDY